MAACSSSSSSEDHPLADGGAIDATADGGVAPDGASTADAGDGGASTAPEPIAVAAGARHTCAIVRYPAADVTYCWGDGSVGQLGGAGAGLVKVALPANTVLAELQAHGTSDTTCAIDAGSVVVCWGANASGQSGVALSSSAAPSRVLSNAMPFAADSLRVGGASACAAVANSVAIVPACWGRNTSCELGTSAAPCTPDASAEPIVGEALAVASDAEDLALGRAHGCAALASGAVACWGANEAGQAEPGGAPVVSPPAEVVASAAVSVAAGDAFSCALGEDGVVSCWGDNRRGVIADDGLTTQRARVTSFPGAVAKSIRAGAGFACAEVADKLVCRGAGDLGQLGRGAAIERGSPGDVSGIAKPRAYALGGAHACAIVDGASGRGELRCWGDNATGQVDPTAPKTPVLAPRALIFPTIPPS